MKRERKKTPGKKGIRLFAVMAILSLAPLIASIGIISTVSASVVRDNLEENTKNTLMIVANNLASYCYDNEITAMNASNYYEYIDSLKPYDIEMAIIAEGMPCTTSIKSENDYRIREIPLGPDSEALEQGYYDRNVEIDGKVYYGYYVPIKADGRIIAVAFAGERQENVIGQIRNVIAIFVVIAAVLVLVFMVIVLLFSRNLSRLFDRIGRRINALSEGDLSRQKAESSPVRELGMLLDTTDTMQQKLSATIGDVTDASEKLTDDIREVTTLSENSANKARQISSSVDRLSESTVTMDENVRNINEQMMEIGKCVNDISESVEGLYSSSDKTLQTNNEAMAYMDAIMKNSVKSVEAVSDIQEQIRQTNASIAEIDQAVELILEIAEQTNLLSLNASIEAARAGEMGKGFAVVALEIRKLSEQSGRGAEMIKDVAQTISAKSQKSVQLADIVHEIIQSEQDNVSRTQAKFAEHSEDIHQSVEEIRSIAEKTEHLLQYKETVIGNVQELNSFSRENAADQEEVNENIGQIIKEVQRVNEHCRKMNDMAREMGQSVAYFKR